MLALSSLVAYDAVLIADAWLALDNTSRGHA